MRCSELTDPELVDLLRRGDYDAFTEIYQRYVKGLMAYVRKNIQSKEEGEEILQDVFARLWTKRSTTIITSLRHFLFCAVRYEIINYFKRTATAKRYEEHYEIFEIAYSRMKSTDREPEAIQKAIEEIISTLPKRCQAAIRLRMSENLTHQQIAERMNITKKTVETYMLMAFDHIRSSPFQERLDYYS
ncbi:MAG TPA: sigma-70 family RNA polymerase sigma factor [Cyclobacteriaceae bacterium]|nr:sigma-70 family RNA polymerase sigma factor [Cyclobacteriaceae bacterium]